MDTERADPGDRFNLGPKYFLDDGLERDEAKDFLW